MLCRIPIGGGEVFHILFHAVSDDDGRFCGVLRRRCDVPFAGCRQQPFSFHLHNDAGGPIRCVLLNSSIEASHMYQIKFNKSRRTKMVTNTVIVVHDTCIQSIIQSNSNKMKLKIKHK